MFPENNHHVNNVRSCHPVVVPPAPPHPPPAFHPNNPINNTKRLSFTQHHHMSNPFDTSNTTTTTTTNSLPNINHITPTAAANTTTTTTTAAFTATTAVAAAASPSIPMSPGPPPGFGPPRFPPHVLNHHHPPPVPPAPPPLPHPPIHTLPPPTHIPVPPTTSAPHNCPHNTGQTLLTDVLNPYSAHDMTDHTTNPYVKAFSDANNILNINNNNNNNNSNSFHNNNSVVQQLPAVAEHLVVAPSRPAVINQLNAHVAHVHHQHPLQPIIDQTAIASAAVGGSRSHQHAVPLPTTTTTTTRAAAVTTASNLPNIPIPLPLTNTSTTATATGEAQMDMFRPVVGDPQPHPQTHAQHYQLFDTHNGSNGSSSDNLDVGAPSLLQQQHADAILSNQNDQQQQMHQHQHDLAPHHHHHMPRLQQQHQQSSSSSSSSHHRGQSSNNLFPSQLQQQQQQSYDVGKNSGNINLPLPLPLPLPMPLAAAPTPGLSQHNNVAQTNGTHLNHQSGNTSSNGHHVTATAAQMQHYDRADIAQLVDVNKHSNSLPQPLMQVHMQVQHQSRIGSLLDMSAGSSYAAQHSRYSTVGGGVSNALLNPLAHAAATQSSSHNNLSLPLPAAVAQPTCHSHLFHQQQQQHQQNELCGLPGFPPQPAAALRQQQYVTTTATTAHDSNLNMNNNGTRHGHHHYLHHHHHHAVLPDLPSSIQLTSCTPASPLRPSVLSLATVTHQQQQQKQQHNVTGAPHTQITALPAVTVNVVGPSSRQAPPLAPAFLGVVGQQQQKQAVQHELHHQQQQPAVLPPLTDLAALHNCPAVHRRHVPGVAWQHEALQQQHQQADQQLPQQVQPLHNVLPLTTSGDAMVDIVPNPAAIAAATTATTAATAVLMRDDDDDDDDDNDGGGDDDIDDEDEDVVTINAAANAVTMVAHPEPEPQSPPMTTARMRIAMREQAEAQARANESSTLLSPLLSPLLPARSSSLSTSAAVASRAMVSSRVGGGGEVGVLEIPLPPHAASYVAQAERELHHASDDSFQSGVSWTEASLTQILTYELEDLCVKGAARLARLRRQDQLEQEERERLRWNRAATTTGQPCEQLFVYRHQQQLQVQMQQCSPSHSLCTSSSSSSSYVSSSSSTLMMMLNNQQQQQQHYGHQQQHVQGGNIAAMDKTTAMVVMTGHSTCTNNAYDDNQHHQQQEEIQQQQRFDCFNSHVKQPFQLSYYIGRLVSCANCSVSAFIVMLAYVDRVQQRCKYLQLTDLNVHRVVLAALLAAVKFVDDEVYSNAHYASIGGVDVAELNGLEYVFNQAVDWKLFVTGEEYRAYESALLEQWTRTNAQGERVVMPPPSLHAGVVVWE